MFLTKNNLAKQAEALFNQLQKSATKLYQSQLGELANLEASKTILNSSTELQIAFILTTFYVIRKVVKKLGEPTKENIYRFYNLLNAKDYPLTAMRVVRLLFKKSLPFSGDDILKMVDYTADLKVLTTFAMPYLEVLISKIEQYVEVNGSTPELDAALVRLFRGLCYTANAPEAKLRKRIESILNGPKTLPIDEGEAWSDKAIANFHSLPEAEQQLWVKIFEHCINVSGGQPTGKWLNAASGMLKELDTKQFLRQLFEWFPLVDKPRTQVIESWSQYQPNPNLLITEVNADILKGLVWFASLIEDKELARVLTALALSAYKKIPGVGPRAVKIGNACIYSLGAMPGMHGIGHLAILKVKVRFKTAVKGIDNALNAAAARLGVPADELEEMSVPAYGLTEVGLLRESIGEYLAELQVTGTHTTELLWEKADGKKQKAIPTVIKEHYAEDLKELKDAAKDIQQMLPAQRERLDRLFIQNKTWPYDTWKERYMDHPLVGYLARRLIWSFDNNGEKTNGIYLEGKIVDLYDNPLKDLTEKTVVTLWHPIDHKVDEIMKWRRWLEKHLVQQPFKQAHREVYYLTDAERQTGVYSNRYAAHIVKQHQFNSLCAARGWRNVLKLLVDGDFPPPTLKLPQWNLRVEFWTDGVGDNYSVDTNETGTFYYLVTDQVRFLPLDARENLGHASNRGQVDTTPPLPLELISPLVFSEVMRDIDLFVGVSSVGNDPTWSDGGPEGRFQDYWREVSFGDLSATAHTRKQILEELIPRLKIKDRCTFDEKYLIVQGDIRTYKIHLGSGNILMSPTDQYLCIVPSRNAEFSRGEKLFLPFEGDTTLALIISKALMLAEDTKITDPTIVTQLKHK